MCSHPAPSVTKRSPGASVFNDADGNGVKDVGEAAFTNAVIEAQPGSYLTAPDVFGNYVLPIDTGTFVLDGRAGVPGICNPRQAKLLAACSAKAFTRITSLENGLELSPYFA